MAALTETIGYIHSVGNIGNQKILVDPNEASSPVLSPVGILLSDGTVWTGAVTTTGTVTSTPAASELHIGQVGSPLESISVTPTVSTSPAYTAGDCVGGKQTLTGAARTSGGRVILESINVLDLGNQKAALTILFFDSDPAAATITDNAAFVWSTDHSKLLGKVNIAAADYETIASEAVATVKAIGLLLEASGSANLFAVVVTTGTPTYTATTDIRITYGFLQG